MKTRTVAVPLVGSSLALHMAQAHHSGGVEPGGCARRSFDTGSLRFQPKGKIVLTVGASLSDQNFWQQLFA
jgi:hypothetical protein